MTRKKIWKKYGHWKYVLFLIPSLGIWFTLGVLPNLQTIPLAFYKWIMISPERVFYGLRNFRAIFATPTYMTELRTTFLYILFLFVIQTGLALILALTLQKNTRHNKAFRAFFFVPITFSSVLVALTWTYMYDPNIGIINQFLTALGIHGFTSFAWLGSPTLGILCVVIVHVWAGVGVPMTFFIAGLQTVPVDLYEAATVEGASSWQSFRHITMPMILPTFLRISMLTIIAGAMTFDYVFLLGTQLGQGPLDTWIVTIYRALSPSATNTINKNMGLPCAMGVLLMIPLIIFYAIQYFANKRAESNIGIGGA